LSISSLGTLGFKTLNMATSLASFLPVLAIAGLSVIPLAAQSLVSVNVSTQPSGARYTVDGLQYIQPTNFLWPVGSKHIISIVSPTYSSQNTLICETPNDTGVIQYEPGCRARYLFQSWETSGGPLGTAAALSQTITVDPNLRFVRANFSVEYRVDLSFYSRSTPSSPEKCLANASTLGPKPTEYGSGVVFANGICLDGSGWVWASAGPMTLQAIPYDGYIFRGWMFDNNPRDLGQTAAIEVRGPMVINPRFEPAKRVRLYTNPLALRLRIDSTEILSIDPGNFVITYPIPGYFDWVGGSRHTIGGVSPQVDIDNRTWVFKSWSNGNGQDSQITIDNETNVALTLTANFVRGVHASFLTEPAGLKLNVEGRDNWPTTNFIWGVGMKYVVTAPAEQTDLRGRKYLFKGWSNSGPPTQEITPTEDQIAPGIRLIAKFEAVPQAVIQSSIPGMKISVDGADCVSPCRLDRPTGTVLQLAVPQVVPISDLSRHEFVGWSDGGAAVRNLTVSADSQTLVAIYRVANRLVLVSDPGEGANLAVHPASDDGFYPADSNVTITAEAKPGFKFRRWEGDLAGTLRSGVVSMSMSRLVRALLDKVPFVAATGVKNAAADLPAPGVAAGLIAIYGGSLGKAFEVGPSNPLSQTLGGTVVLVGDRLLPLIYVSPEQINAQLPSDLEPGKYELTVRTDGMPDVRSEFEVVRNAPGLFVNQVETTAYAVALHEDGSAVTTESPARRNETVTLFGTGFGPYNRRVVDGFATPAAPAAILVDRVEVVVGAARLEPVFAGAAPGLTGITATRFRVGADVAGPVEVKVVVNGRESNPVILPVE
jgi:uncharacterized protein (TIGR03437 family)